MMSMLAAVSRFGLNRMTRTLSSSSFSSSHSPCCSLFSYPLKEETRKCPSCHPRQQRPRQMSFHSLASLLKGNMMYSTSICEFSLSSLVFSSSDHLTTSPFHRKQNRKTLVEWCREFRLPISGTVPALTARLIDFSEDREKWEDQ